MKKNILVVAMALFIMFFSSCRVSSENEAKELGSSLYNAANISITASITADYGEKAYIFRLKLIADGNDWSVEVLEPENIAGITARCSDGDLAMEFDDVILDTGEFTSTKITPVNALPLILSAWGGAHISEALPESDDSIWVSYTVSDSTVVRTLYDTNTRLPVYAYIEINGLTVISAEFLNIVADEHAQL